MLYSYNKHCNNKGDVKLSDHKICYQTIRY